MRVPKNVWLFDPYCGVTYRSIFATFRKTHEFMGRWQAGTTSIPPVISGDSAANRTPPRGVARAGNGMMSVIPARIVVLSATAGSRFGPWTIPATNVRAEGGSELLWERGFRCSTDPIGVFCASTCVAASTENPSGKCRFRTRGRLHRFHGLIGGATINRGSLQDVCVAICKNKFLFSTFANLNDHALRADVNACRG
jgi:hypothetical protein